MMKLFDNVLAVTLSERIMNGELTLNQAREQFGLESIEDKAFDTYMVSSLKGLDE